jgi:hypothetical protein
MASRLCNLVRAEAKGGAFALFAYRKWTLSRTPIRTPRCNRETTTIMFAQTLYIEPIFLARYPVTSQEAPAKAARG